MAAMQAPNSSTLELPFMDEAHRHFVDRLGLVDKADDAALAAAWQELVECAAENFGCQDRWMKSTGYSLQKDHTIQHRVVLSVMREGLLQAREGKLLQVREMAHQLRGWYLKHVQSMDAALALHLLSSGFDPSSEALGAVSTAAKSTGTAASLAFH